MGFRADQLSLSGASWLIDPGLQFVLSVLGGAEDKVRIVGGAVRDALAERPVGDIDLATSWHPDVVLRLAAKAGIKTVPTGLSHGVVTLLHAGCSYEVASLRRDVETDGRHAKVVFTEDWALDAARRDFTMNALYATMKGEIFDPFSGYQDLLSGKVRFIGDPLKRISEDYLRILRFFRFSSEWADRCMDADGLAACIAARSGLQSLAPERLYQEFLRLLRCTEPEWILSVMSDLGFLQDILKGNSFLSSLKQYLLAERNWRLEIDPVRRLLFLACACPEDADRLRGCFALSNADYLRLKTVCTEYARCSSPMEEQWWKGFLYRFGPRSYQDLVAFAAVRSTGVGEKSHWKERFLLPEYWEKPIFPWSGRDLINQGMSSGPAVGRMLKQLEQEWVVQNFPSSPKKLDEIFSKVSLKFSQREGNDNG